MDDMGVGWMDWMDRQRKTERTSSVHEGRARGDGEAVEVRPHRAAAGGQRDAFAGGGLDGGLHWLVV